MNSKNTPQDLVRRAGLLLLLLLLTCFGNWSAYADAYIVNDWTLDNPPPAGTVTFSGGAVNGPAFGSPQAFHLLPNIPERQTTVVFSTNIIGRPLATLNAQFGFDMNNSSDGSHGANGFSFCYGVLDDGTWYPFTDLGPTNNLGLVVQFITRQFEQQNDYIKILWKGQQIDYRELVMWRSISPTMNGCLNPFTFNIQVDETGHLSWSITNVDASCNPVLTNSFSNSGLTLSGWTNTPTANWAFGFGGRSGGFSMYCSMSDITIHGAVKPTLDLSSAPTLSALQDQPLTQSYLISSPDPAFPISDMILKATAANNTLIPNDHISIVQNQGNAALTFTNARGLAGDTSIHIEILPASDQNLVSAYDIPVHIEPNTPPVIAMADSAAVQHGQTIVIDYSATSKNWQNVPGGLSVTVAEAPPSGVPLIQSNSLFFASASALSAPLYITPRLDRSGNTQIAVTVTDGSGSSTTHYVALAVNPAPNVPTVTGARSALSFNEIANSFGIERPQYAAGDQIPALGSQFTIEAWVKPSALPEASFNPIASFGYYVTPGNYAMLALQQNGLPSFAGNGNDAIPATGTPVPLNVWSHVAVVVDVTKVKFYINGVLAAAATLGVPANAAIGQIGVGYDLDNQTSFHGQLDEVRIWSSARTDDMIAGDMYQRPDLTDPTLVRYFDFNEEFNRFDGATGAILYGTLRDVSSHYGGLSLYGLPIYVPGVALDTPLAMPQNTNAVFNLVATRVEGTNIYSPANGAGLVHAIYFGSGSLTNVASLTNNPDFPKNPSVMTAMGDYLEIPENVVTKAGELIRGWLIPPQTGNYTFWISARNEGEIWLSTNAASTSGLTRIASVPAGGVNFHQWSSYTQQKSGAIRLQAGSSYYFEVRHQAGDPAVTHNSTHLSVRWQLPDGTMESPLPAFRVAPSLQPLSDGETITLSEPPQSGSILLSGGSLRYTPFFNYFGPDEFSYYVTNNSGLASPPARLPLNITNIYNHPMIGSGNALYQNGGAEIVSADSISLPPGQSFTIEAWAFAAPVTNYCLRLNGSSQYVAVTNFGAIAPTNEVTVEFWARPTAAGLQSPFRLDPDDSTNRFMGTVNYYTDNNSYFDFGNILGNPSGRLQTPSPAANTWVHYAMVSSQSGNYMSIYTNGVLAASKTGMTPFQRGAYTLTLGANGSGGFNFIGLIYDFRIWQVARSGAEIRSTMFSPPAGNEPGLLLYYPLDEGTGNVATNLAVATGSAFNGVLQNGAGWTNSSPVGQGGYLVSAGTAVKDQGLNFGWGDDGRFRFGFWQDDALTPVPYADTSWHHWAGTYDAVTKFRSIYQDGVLVAQDVSTNQMQLPPDSVLYLGSLFGGPPFHHGGLDEVRIWNYARSVEQINSTLTSPLAGNEEGLLEYYRLDEGNGLTVNDSSPAGNSGTIIGAATWLTNTTHFGVAVVPRNSPGQQIYLPGFDPNNLPLTYGVQRITAQGGKVAGNGPTVTYIPRTNFWGFDSFYYSITNSANQVATIPMYVVVAFVNLPPSISSFLDQAVEEEDPPLVLSFAIGDVDTDPESLIVTAQSSNPTLLPASAITFQAPLGPANQARTVTLSPVAGEVGATTVTITVSDGDLSASSSFKYEVKSRLAFAPIDLGVLTGQPYSVASDINAAGQVVGYTATDDSESHPRGFFYTGFGPLATTIATATLGGDGSRLAHLNSKGKAVGASLTAGANINAFVASPAQSAVLTNLGSLVGGIESAATGINDEGLVVGYSQVGGGVYHPFVAGIQTMTDLGVPNGASQAFATAVNNLRTIVGYSITGTGQTNAFVYDYYGATFTNLIQPPGADGSVATTINDAGEVAGYLFTNGQTHAAIALSGGWSDLGDMLGGGSARINDMNHFRQAVGTALNTNSQWQAFYYEDGHAYNLNQLLPSDSQDWNLVEARAINDQGQIVGVGQRNGQTRAFLLFPATEIGRRVFRPDGTLPTMPQVTLIQIPSQDDSPQNAFYWSQNDTKLFAIRPVAAFVGWHTGIYATYTNETQFGDQIIRQLFTNEVLNTTISFNVWPRDPDIHVAGAPVELQPPFTNFNYSFSSLAYNTADGAAVDTGSKIFTSPAPGFSVFQYLVSNGNPPNPSKQLVRFTVARTFAWNDTNILVTNITATVGSAITNTNHDDYPGRNGYVLFTNAYYDGAGSNPAYVRTNRSGVIVPVNAETNAGFSDLVVAWYKRNKLGVAWPDLPVKYQLVWPTNAPEIVIASGLGSGALNPAQYPNAQVYYQPDPTLPGYNPNEEHALLAGGVLYALRCDLNGAGGIRHSEPFALLKYQDPASGLWRIQPYQVIAEQAPYFFNYPGTAGNQILPPMPLALLPQADQTAGVSGPFWEDYANRFYARAAGQGGGSAQIVMHYFYALQPGFWYDIDNNGTNELPVGAEVPWLDRLNTNSPSGVPVDTVYTIYWPDSVPTLFFGQTLSTAINGLPDVQDMASVQTIYNDLDPLGLDAINQLARFFDPLSARTVPVNNLDPDWTGNFNLTTDPSTGYMIFSDLPYYLRVRLFYDPINNLLGFQGFQSISPTGPGASIFLINVMSPGERNAIQALDNGGVPGFDELVQQLYVLTRNPNQLDVDPHDGVPDDALLIGLTTNSAGILVPEQLGGGPKALTAGLPVQSQSSLQGTWFSFDGTNGSAEPHNSAPYPDITNNFTIEFWARPAGGRISTPQANNGVNVSQQQFAIVPLQGTYAYGSQHLTAGVSVGTNGVSVFIHGTLLLDSVLVYDMPITNWTHIGVVYDSGTPSLYVNGQLVHVGLKAPAGFSVHPSTLMGGWQARPDLDRYVGGLRQVRLWNSALPQSTLQSRMYLSVPGNANGLAGCWDLDSIHTVRDPFSPASSSYAQDISSRANDAYLDPGVSTIPPPGVELEQGTLSIDARYLVLAENNNSTLGGLPVTLHVLQVLGGPYQGWLQQIQSDDVLDERVTLHHVSDFAGDPSQLYFEWYYHPSDANGVPAPPDPDHPEDSGWTVFPGNGLGVDSITIGQTNLSSLVALSDNWFYLRYRGYDVNGTTTNWSAWIGDPSGTPSSPRPTLVEGWVKRVLGGINLFNQRGTNFESFPVNTLVSSIAQAGPRYEGDVALNPSTLNTPGLIQIYQTILNRAASLSINGTPAVDYAPADQALLLAAGQISDMYMLLGNEANAEADDPTIGLNPALPDSGSLASSIFAFENQTGSLLEQELALLHGRDDTDAGVSAAPVYNRLFWNFTGGDGEVAYVATFNINDYNHDGSIDANDAAILYPQGHGDAWGHYLTALTTYYRLLQNTNFTWTPQSESVNIGGVAVAVGYLHERKFAAAALARAQAGAQIVDRTYRWDYDEDSSGLWNGYRDTNPQRAWGTMDWGLRAAHGAYFDWLTANAILPAVDPDPSHIGIQKIDRTTVPELSQIPAEAILMQNVLDSADHGYNPLGLASTVVPFDLDPTASLDNFSLETHFEQIYDRTLTVLQNAVTTFGQASEVTDALRAQADTETDFNSSVYQQEVAYRNDLLGFFGYPYAGDIGPGTPNPSGYIGPDLYHWMYLDSTDLTGAAMATVTNFNGFYAPFQQAAGKYQFQFDDDITGTVGDQSISQDSLLTVNYPISSGQYPGFAPASWGSRRAEGSLQTALRNLVQAQTSLQQAIVAHQVLVNQINSQLNLLQARYQLNADLLTLYNNKQATSAGLNTALLAAKVAEQAAEATGEVTSETVKAAIAAIPTVEGLADDALAPARGAILAAAIPLETTTDGLKLGAQYLQSALDYAKDIADVVIETQVNVANENYAAQQSLQDFQNLVRQEAGLRLSMLQQAMAVAQAQQTYLTTLAQAQQALQQRIIFRQLTAGSAAQMRYRDDAFRIFRNDALQRYETQFQLAARYVYLAAKAFDYQINMASVGATDFASSAVHEQMLGQLDANGNPSAGRSGLASILAQLKQNFDVIKPNLGLTSPSTELAQFSLRTEWKRILPPGTNSLDDAIWRGQLQAYIVTNLWNVPEFVQYCRPFAPQSAGPQPGIVISIPGTTITAGQNFFGRPLAAQDYSYDPSQFSTCIRAAAVWFTGYDSTTLARSPRVYLVPVGDDVLRAPEANNFTLRYWHIVEQKVPVPFPASSAPSSSWLTDTLDISDQFADRARHSAFRAYPDDGGGIPADFNPSTRLFGRSVANTRWVMIIPGAYLNGDPNQGLTDFINSVTDIKLYFQTYSASGN